MTDITGSAIDEDLSADTQDDLYEKNLEYLRTSSPQLYAELKAVKTLHSRLVRVGDDDWDVEFRGSRFYGRGARAEAEAQMTEPGRWTRLVTGGPGRNSTDNFASSFVVAAEDKMEAAGIQPGVELRNDEGYYLIVFGIGLGAHLRRIRDVTKCKVMILVEPNVELIAHTLRVFDWEEFLTEAKEKGTNVLWQRGENDFSVALHIRQALRFYNPGRLDGSYIYKHYDSRLMQSVHSLLMAETGVLLNGLGWLDDEILMIINSHANLNDGSALMYQPPKGNFDWPVFIVGSGPSIDNDLDYIAANADKAIVVACGTGLGPLQRRGIQPDFYVELENLPESYIYLQSVLAKGRSLAGMTLIATTTIDPRIAPLFDRAIWFMRDGLVSFPTFAYDRSMEVPNINPTVTNTGLGFMIAAGFREFYFFGVDLGSKDPARHHSVDTPYMEGVLPYPHALADKLPGNFGGVVYTENILKWAHDSFEKIIAMKRMGRRFYNCSDGALITGATPKMARSLKLPERKEAKSAVIERMIAGYRPYGRDEFRKAWQPERHFEELSEFRDRLLKICEDWSPEDPWDYIHQMVRQMLPADGVTRPPMHYFRGSMMLALLSGTYYLNRVEPERRPEAHVIVHDELMALIHRMHDRVVSRLSHLPAAAEA